MKSYIGTKIIKAEPMTDKEFNTQNVTPETFIGTGKEGYKVEYEDGYVSWSPKDVFERAYREIPMILTDAVNQIQNDLGDEIILSDKLNIPKVYEFIWDAVRLGISYEVGLSKPVKEMTAELKTMNQTGHYLVSSDAPATHDVFVDINITEEDTAETIYFKIESAYVVDTNFDSENNDISSFTLTITKL